MTQQTNFNDAHDDSMARASTICKWLDVSKSTIWRKVAEGSFPKPVRLFEGVTAWRTGDVRAWLQSRVQAE